MLDAVDGQSSMCTYSLSGSGWPIHVRILFMICFWLCVVYLSRVSSHVNEAEQHCRRCMCQSTTATVSCHAILCVCVFLLLVVDVVVAGVLVSV